MKHFLVTRFNLKHNNWKTGKDGQKVLTDTWLIHRFKLFEKYCLPSVKNQSNQNFIWCCFFDNSTPQEYMVRIKKLSTSYNNFVPIFINGMAELHTALKKFITTNGMLHMPVDTFWMS